MITYNWNNIELVAYHNEYGKSDVVFSIEADLVAEQDGVQETKRCCFGVAYNSESSFVSINSIDKQTAISWIESSVNDDALQTIKDELASRFIFKRVKIA